jgi:hypothetical protein
LEPDGTRAALIVEQLIHAEYNNARRYILRTVSFPIVDITQKHTYI